MKKKTLKAPKKALLELSPLQLAQVVGGVGQIGGGVLVPIGGEGN